MVTELEGESDGVTVSRGVGGESLAEVSEVSAYVFCGAVCVGWGGSRV